ncbi:hypothetical protein AVEN_130707-1 [Araneus ventricosus]|uniref:Uncharacterized protein n=1 Tax=Araneus ventricosus TaxID=182803 RepID=A0A4Y2F994_ARAVE|nr:hypothetical protein AVEN_130707-1 [Araneus ventricosus]
MLFPAASCNTSLQTRHQLPLKSQIHEIHSIKCQLYSTSPQAKLPSRFRWPMDSVRNNELGTPLLSLARHVQLVVNLGQSRTHIVQKEGNNSPQTYPRLHGVE